MDTSPKLYSYQAFGLAIASMLACPELLPYEGAPDVVVLYGAVPEALTGVKEPEFWYQKKSETVLLKIPSIAKYLILRGKKIIIERTPEAHENEVRLFLFSFAFGALLHQRGLFPVHGSAIEVNGGAVVFVGTPGSGKSTLAGAFHQRGYRAVADEICVLSTSTGDLPLVLPSFPQLQLWCDTLEKLGKNPEELHRVTPEFDKRNFPLGEGFCANPLSLHRIYLLTTTSTQEIKLTRLHGMEKLVTLMDNTYHPEFLTEPERKKQHFLQCVGVARRVAVSCVTRPRWPFLLGDLADAVEQDWAKEAAP